MMNIRLRTYYFETELESVDKFLSILELHSATTIFNISLKLPLLFLLLLIASCLPFIRLD